MSDEWKCQGCGTEIPDDQVLSQGLCVDCLLEINNYGECGPAPDFQTTGTLLTGLDLLEHSFNSAAALVHERNAKWWVDFLTGQPLQRNVGELLMLCVRKLSEAMEGDKKDLQDDKLPHRKMFEVKLADCIILILDIAGGLGLDLGGAIVEKLEYNSKRLGHTHEHCLAEGDKKY
jgi:NTP pyrophosphatase (non-canonical NTP hydrolase)